MRGASRNVRGTGRTTRGQGKFQRGSRRTMRGTCKSGRGRRRNGKKPVKMPKNRVLTVLGHYRWSKRDSGLIRPTENRAEPLRLARNVQQRWNQRVAISKVVSPRIKITGAAPAH